MTESWGDPAWPDPYAAPARLVRPQLDVDGPGAQRRLTVAVRALILLPHLVVSVLLTVVFLVVVVVGWFGALVLGRLPRWIESYVIGYLAFVVRVQASLMLMVDRYPGFSFDPHEGAARIDVAGARVNRWGVLFRWLLIIPAYVVGQVLGIGWTVLAIPFWLVVLVLGRTPRPIFLVSALVLRFQLRYQAYLAMLCDAYPLVGVVGDPAPVGAPPDHESLGTGTRPLRPTSGARALFGLLVALGVVGWVASVFANQSLEARGSRIDAGNKTLKAYNTLNSTVADVAEGVPQCDTVACAHRHAARLERDADNLHRVAASTNYPDDVVGEAEAVSVDAARVSAIAGELQTTRTISSFQRLLAASGVDADLSKLRRDLDALLDDLR